ncbi:MAG TPA: hypothetical protein VMF58_16025 [Rhizomicrobium sp.]|nr:hypothetical protein [Rhizomicrobium sp.]
MNPITPERLNVVTRASIRRAGPRYTPAVDPSAPNLEIASLVEAFETLGQSPRYRKRLNDIENAIRSAWSGAPSAIRALYSKSVSDLDGGAKLLAQLQTEPPGTSTRTIYRIKQHLKLIRRRIQPHEDLVYNPPANPDGTKQSSEERNRSVKALQDFLSPFDDLQQLIQSPQFGLVLTNKLFLLGSWGTGKTHLLCDVARKRMKEGVPSLLLLAQTLEATKDPLESVCKVSGLCKNPQQLLSALDRLGKKNGCRALLMIDAINEGDRAAWFKYSASIARLLREYPNVALVLSCRTPFARQVMTLKARGEFVELEHSGFADIEFDAQKAFFKHYNIPTPHLPLLAPEFSRPLFLKILCETISSLSRKTKLKRINDFAAGHKGMTKLLEDFVVRIGAQIEADFRLPPKTCWFLLKGTGDQHKKIGIAPQMAASGIDHLPREDCLRIIMEVTKLKKSRAKDFLARAMADGLLAEDSIYDESWKDVIRLPYQRFSDHLISRYLLSEHLKVDSATHIRSAFKDDQPLGRAFSMDQWGYSYRMPGIASAIMLEFPERVKRSPIPPDERELYFYLPKKNRAADALASAFIDGLLWRSTDSFCKQTDHIVGHFLGAHQAQDMLEALTCLASRTGHPYNAKRLFGYLAKQKLIDRDLFWSEFLRSREPASAVYRVLDWVRTASLREVGEETATNLAYLCGIFLTTTVRPLRDRATHCLVLLGERFPRALFSVALEAMSFNDPYVPERLLAASYGTLMRIWAFPPPDLPGAVLPLASDLSLRLRGDEQTPPIEHILMRDFASGICELAAKVVAPADVERVLRPESASTMSVIPDAADITKASVEKADDAIRMDFDNYTTGRLVSGRSNYDEDHEDYQRVQRQIRWRILNLGWSSERFQQVDGMISNSNYYGGRREEAGKTDRYGKKYSWIALFEVAGRLKLDGKLPDRDNPRVSDVDIDPSFPDSGISWRPQTKRLFDTGNMTLPQWVGAGPSPDYRDLLNPEVVDGRRGPWVLLQGYVSEVHSKDKREVFSFLRGLLVAHLDVNRIEELVSGVEYPGNTAIPDPGQDYYIFAGEIGWSSKVEHWLRRPDGSARPHTGRAFDQTEHKTVLKRYGALPAFEQYQVQHRYRETPGPDQLVPVNEYTQIPGVRVEVPTMEYSWESYHSVENTGGSPTYPSASVAEFLQLRKYGSGVDMFDLKKDLATLYRTSRGNEDKNRFDLLYLRADLMKKYLRKTRRKLVWINWGERGVHYSAKNAEALRDHPGMRDVWDHHSHIHKQFVRWGD